jgi:hypothetical protein
MTDQNSSANQSEQKRFALLRVLKATVTLPAQVTFYAAALGAIALIPGVSLPPALATVAGGVGVNILSGILERVARGEQISDARIRQQIKIAIDESHIAGKLADRDTQIMIARLFRRHDVLKFAIQNNEYVILQRLAEQADQYRAFVAELRGDISMIHAEVRKLATRQQSDEIIELLQHLLKLLQPLLAEKEKHLLGDKEPLEDQVPSVLDEVFCELASCVEVMFRDAAIRDAAACMRKVNSVRSGLRDLEELGVASHTICALEHYVEALQHLIESYCYIFDESGTPDFYEALAQYLDDAARSFGESHTRIGDAFSLFFTAWATIKRTKKLYSDPAKMETVIERHGREIPEGLLASSHQFQEHPMGAFAEGEASYSLGWAFVFKSLSASGSLRQARLLDQAASCFQQAAGHYGRADIDPIHRPLANADHCLFRAISFIILSQRENLSSEVCCDNLQKARDLLAEAASLFLGIERVELAAVMMRMLLVVEKERATLEEVPLLEQQTLNGLISSMFTEKQWLEMGNLQTEILDLVSLQAVSRMPEMLLQSQLFIDAISIIRKSDQEDLQDALVQVVSPQVSALLTEQYLTN